MKRCQTILEEFMDGMQNWSNICSTKDQEIKWVGGMEGSEGFSYLMMQEQRLWHPQLD